MPQTQVQMLDDLTQKVFGGSAKRLVMRMVSTGRLSPAEIAEIQRLVESEGEQMMILDFLSSDLAWRLGWTLLHSVWQVFLIWAVVAVTLAFLAHRSPSSRYLVACCGMAAMFVPLAVTFMLVGSRQQRQLTLPPRPS